MALRKEDIIVGATYRHYKNNQLYKIVHIAEHTETGDVLVVYEALYGEHKIWARPQSMFMEDVYVNIDGKEQTLSRFMLVCR